MKYGWGKWQEWGDKDWGGRWPFIGDQNEQPFVLLLRVIQLNNKPLPIGGFTEQAMSQMLREVAGVVSKEVVVMNDWKVVMELEEETSLIDVSRVIHGLFHWGGQSISVDSLVAKKFDGWDS